MWHILTALSNTIYLGENMKVKLFDESHEKLLENKVNEFLLTIKDKDIIDIKYEVSTCIFSDEQIYCFSAMIIYIE